MYHRAALTALLVILAACESQRPRVITLTEAITLRTPDDSTALLQSSHAIVDGQGRFFVAPIAEPGQIAAFAPDGRFLRTIGRFGNGPGELGRITRIAAVPGDSVLVFHSGYRMSVVAPTLMVARSIRLGGLVIDAVRSPGGRIIMSGLVGQRQRIAHPYHFVGDTGIEQSFGAGADTSVRGAELRVRSLAPARDGGFWSAHVNRYQIDRIDTAGNVRPTISRTVSWFPPWTNAEGAPPWLIRPNPKLSAVRESVTGVLWTLVLVPSAKWKPVTNGLAVRGDAPFATPSLSDIDVILDRMVEALDPRTGEAIASRRVAGSYVAFVGGDMLARHRERDDGTIEIVLSRLSLRSTARSNR